MSTADDMFPVGPATPPRDTQGTVRDQIDQRAGSSQRINAEDPAFQEVTQPAPKPEVIYRDVPIISLNTQWTPVTVTNALNSMLSGVFEWPGQLVDMIIADDRVTAVMNSRLTGLFGREVRFTEAQGKAKGSRAAREVKDAWIDNWDYLNTDGSLYQIGAYQNLFGWWPAQNIWDTAGPVWKVRPVPWHGRYTYYNWDVRKYVAISQDGALPIFPGDGKWILHAPRGPYRAWLWGSMRAIALPWMLRTYSLQDMAGFAEVYGAPTRVGYVPAAADPAQRTAFVQQLSALGANSTLLIPRGVDKDQGYGYEIVSAGSADWTIFPGLMDRCDLHITLAILMQNLTTEVTGGSFAATQAHMDIRQSGIEADNQAWKRTIYQQIARPFAAFNFGDADLAPQTEWDVTSREEQTDRSQRFYSFGQAVQILRQGGVQFDDPSDLREFALNEFGVRLPDSTKLAPPDNGAGSGAASVADTAATKTVKGDKPEAKVTVGSAAHARLRREGLRRMRGEK